MTVGILTHNARPYVERTVPAILSWLPPDHELVVVDNGSTDGTVDLLRRFPIHRIEANPDNGYGSGKNALVKLARGTFVLLLDDDVLVPDGQVVKDCLAFCQQHPDTAFVSVPLINAGRDRTPHYGLFFAELKDELGLPQLRGQKYFAAGGFIGALTFFSKDSFQRLGGFDTTYPCHIDDYDLSARAYLQGRRIYTVTTSHAIHLGVDRRSDIERWAARNTYSLCGIVRMILKNYTLSGVVLWVPLASLWILWKTAVKYRDSRNRRVLLSYLKSVVYVFRDVADTLHERRRIQSSRVVRQDVFRRIRAPRPSLPPPLPSTSQSE